jgi:aspartyl-tRNA(Asn)/glutamyl-tRNA(Gln) amidotransferase subunit C
MERIKKVSKERTERLAWLAKIELTEKEKEELTMQLNRILESFRDLDKLELDGVEPTYHALDVTNILREDTPTQCLTQQEALKNGSKLKDGYFVAPKIM